MADDPLTWIARALTAGSPLPLAVRLCRTFAAAAEADGAAITLGSSAVDRSVLSSTGLLAERVEDAQVVAQEGPSIEAFEGRVIVGFVDDADQRRRWPLLHAMLTEAGPAPFLKAYPISPVGTPLGVVSVHRSGGARTDDLSDEDGQVLANAIGVILARHLPDASASDDNWSTRDRLAQATGMVMAQLGVVADDALALLRAQAFSRGLSLGEISGMVVSKELRFDVEDEGR
jgi:hypothetical protein